MYSTETHSQFIALRARGTTLTKIAEQLGISFCLARNWDHEHWEQIRDARHHLMDLFVEKFLPDCGEQLDSLTRELSRINEELDKRDYTKEPTWVLVNRQNMILSRLDKVRANPPLLLLASESPQPNPKLTQNQPISDPAFPAGPDGNGCCL